MSRRVVITLVSACLGAALFVFVPLLTGHRACSIASTPSRLPAGQPTALLSFSGHTNAMFRPRGSRPSANETCATFRLSNSSPQRIAYYAESIEIWTPNGWPTTTLRCTPTNWYGFGAPLAPGESCTFYVPLPLADRWRIRVTCNEKAMGLQGVKDAIADYMANPRAGEDGTRIERFNGFTYQIVSPEVTP